MGDQWKRNPKFIASQFKPGESGNPKGRPKNSVGQALRWLLKHGEDEPATKLAQGLLNIAEDPEATYRERLEAYRLMTQLDGSTWDMAGQSEQDTVKRIELDLLKGGKGKEENEAETA